jgi:4-hydroxy-3-polyprenylbenzoate decarboxylase
MIKDLHDYLDYLSSRRRLAHVKDRVSAELEITAFTDREDKERRYDGRALLFSNVDGYDMPVATNLFGSMSTLKELFDGFSISDTISSIMHPKHAANTASMLKGAKAMLDSKPKVVSFSRSGYEKLGSLDELPILKVWPKDAGKFITLPVVVTESPEDGSLNAGVYRMQVFDDTTTGMHWQAQKGGSLHAYEAMKRGKKLDVSVAIGTDPFNMLSAATPLPQGINEFAFAGMARRARTLLAKNGSYPPVPANSEIIINGYVEPGEKRTEGPFGDHTGYYSIPEEANVFHIKEIYAKKDAVYAASVVGFPWSEDGAIGLFMMDYLKPMVSLVNDSIIDIYLPPEGLFTDVCFIKVKKRFPGEAKKAMFSVLGLGQLSFVKMIVAFDDDIDIKDLSRVLWAMASRVEPERDIQVIKGTPTDTLDHTANLPAFGSKVMIDATKKSKGEGYGREWPETISMSNDLIDAVGRKWRSLG